MKVLPYKMKSRSAKVLANALGVKRVRPDGNFRNNYNHAIVNWGWGGDITFPATRIINEPMYVKRASNKLLSFAAFSIQGITTPEWTTDIDIARDWLFNDGISVVSRKQLRGHSGAGIVINTERSIAPAPLYVQYIKKQDEYRYHVFDGTVIDIQQKKKRREVDNDEVNYQVRNSSNGWVYCRDDITPDSSLSSLAIRAVQALGLEFGAVDIIWNERQRQGYVLEVNTACGLDGSTVDKYVEAIHEYQG